MLSSREKIAMDIFVTELFAYSALFLINPFKGMYNLVVPIYFFKKMSFLKMSVWILFENVPLFILNFLLAFLLRLKFLRQDSHALILAYIFFTIAFNGFLLLETYWNSNLPSLVIASLMGEILSILVASFFSYAGWSLSYAILKTRNHRQVQI